MRSQILNFNVKIGGGAIGVVGKYGLEERIEKGELFIQFCQVENIMKYLS